MSLKKSRVIACIGTIILAFIFHFAYEMLPNFLFSIFFPVNESVWEHMKILYSSIVFYGVIDYFLNKKYNIGYNNFFMNIFICSVSSIIIYLAIFLPLYYSIGESMFISIGVMIITFIIVYILSYFILSLDEKDYNFVWIILTLLGFVIFTYLTYNPIHTQLFFDTKDEIYGIKKRN
jgi:hypothetical protein